MTNVVMSSAALSILDRLNEFISYFPLFAFIALMLAGLNFPISEDLLIVSGALICQADETMLPITLVMIYAGVLLSDFVSFGLGRLVGKGALKLNFVKNALEHRYIGRLKTNFERHGMLTFIACRFIPLGVRNALFMSSGFFGLPLKRFALYDVIASLISVNTLFWLVFMFGEEAEKPLRIAGIVLFIALVCIVLSIVVRAASKLIENLRKKSKQKKANK